MQNEKLYGPGTFKGFIKRRYIRTYILIEWVTCMKYIGALIEEIDALATKRYYKSKLTTNWCRLTHFSATKQKLARKNHSVKEKKFWEGERNISKCKGIKYLPDCNQGQANWISNIFVCLMPIKERNWPTLSFLSPFTCIIWFGQYKHFQL